MRDASTTCDQLAAKTATSAGLERLCSHPADWRSYSNATAIALVASLLSFLGKWRRGINRSSHLRATSKTGDAQFADLPRTPDNQVSVPVTSTGAQCSAAVSRRSQYLAGTLEPATLIRTGPIKGLWPLGCAAGAQALLRTNQIARSNV